MGTPKNAKILTDQLARNNCSVPPEHPSVIPRKKCWAKKPERIERVFTPNFSESRHWLQRVFRRTCFYKTHKALEYQEKAGLMFIKNTGLYSCSLKMLFLKLLPLTYYLPLIKEPEERNLHSLVTRGLWIGRLSMLLHRKGCLFIVKTWKKSAQKHLYPHPDILSCLRGVPKP